MPVLLDARGSTRDPTKKRKKGEIHAWRTQIPASNYDTKKTDIELYAYLRTYVQIKYPKREKAFTQLSLEMKNNSIEIFYIISQSPSIPMSEKTYNAFMKEFMAVGKLMNERINREKELLFKMYEQTNSAKNIS